MIKPSIVFFNERLPRAFYRALAKDAPRADMLLVMGTSLSVAPVSHIPAALRHVPSVFINAERVPACHEGLFDVCPPAPPAPAPLLSPPPIPRRAPAAPPPSRTPRQTARSGPPRHSRPAALPWTLNPAAPADRIYNYFTRQVLVEGPKP